MPRAILVNNVIETQNKQASIDKMFDPTFSPLNQAVVEGKVPKVTSGGRATILNYSENTITIETNAEGPSFLVLFDVYYPNWKASIDTKATPIYLTDFAFRGVAIPAGQHEIKFTYSWL